MRCVSCQEDINAKWGNAIKTNICPWCGQHIMEEHLKNLLTSLGETMSKLSDYPDEVNDWLLSNYNYIKTDSENLIEYIPKELIKKNLVDEEKEFQARKEKRYVKIQNDNGEEEDILVEKTQSEDKTNEFFTRAEAVKPRLDGFRSISEKNEHLKKLTAQIRKEGSSAMLNEAGVSARISPEMMASANPEDIAQIESELFESNISSSLDKEDNDDDLPPIVEVMLSKTNKTNSNNGTYNAKDVASLQQMHSRLNKSKKDFESGANRGSKGGGFSRA